MTKETLQPDAISKAIRTMIQPWLDQDLVPDPLPVLSVARTIGTDPANVFSAIDSEQCWFRLNGGYIKAVLEQTSSEIAQTELRRLRSQVPRQKDKSFTTFQWGEPNKAVVYRTTYRKPKRQSYVKEVKARTNIVFEISDPELEIQLQKQTERAAVKNRLALRQVGKSSKKSREIQEQTLSTQPEWMPLYQNPDSYCAIPENTVLSIGFGIDSTVPIRNLSYPLLGLELLRERPDLILEMYVASEFSSLWGINSDQASTSSYILAKIINRFIEQTYPDISDRIDFVPTRVIDSTKWQLIDQLAQILYQDRELVDFAQNRNGWDSLRYMAAHTLYMRDPLPINPALYIVEPPASGRTVIMIGGKGEKIMYQARRVIADYFGLPSPSQIFTILGETPPYFRYQKEPITGEALTTQFLLQAIPEVYRDYAAILVAIAKSLGSADMDFNQLGAKESQRKQLLALPAILQAIEKLNLLSQV